MTNSSRKRRRALKLSFVPNSRFEDNVVEVRDFKVNMGLLHLSFANRRSVQNMSITIDAAIEKGIINEKKLKQLLPPNMY